MSMQLATQRATEAVYGEGNYDPAAAPSPIIQTILALLMQFLPLLCPAVAIKNEVMNRPRIARMRLLGNTYRMTLPPGVDRFEVVEGAMTVATQSTAEEIAAFQSEIPNKLAPELAAINTVPN